MTTERRAAPGDPTLTASAIARLADVGRAAVSNWRRRYADFPVPVGGTPSSPTFDAREVEQWLRRHGRLHQMDTAQVAWRHIESYQPAAQITDALGICGAYLLARSAQAETTSKAMPTPRQLTARLRALDPQVATLVGDLLPARWTPQLTGLLRTLDRLHTEQDAESAFEYLHSRFLTSAHSMSGLAGTPDAVAEVILALAGSGTHTFDFTSGTGSILRIAADRAARSATPIHCYAQEIKPQYALIALLRLWFVHLRTERAGQAPPPPVVHVGDSLLDDALPGLRADIVFANPPFGVHDWGHDRLAYDPRWTYGLPPRTEPELAWVQHGLAHLAPGGTAVVLMPPAAAQRPAGRRVRAELVRRGALRAVVALPAGLMVPTGIGLHLWVLTQPGPDQPHAGDLLFVDTTATTGDRTLADIAGTAWRAFRSGKKRESSGAHRAVPVIDVLDDQVDLTPQRYLPRAGSTAADPAEIVAMIDEYRLLLDKLTDGLPAVRQAHTTAISTASRADIADLIRSGGISVHRGISRSRAATTAGTVISTTDIQSGGPPTGTPTRAATDDPGPQVQSDDILIATNSREVIAKVATPEQLGAELGPGVQLVRVDTTRFDPWFVAGIISRTDNLRLAGRTSSTTAGTLRLDLKRLTIPVLPLDQQRPYGQVFRHLAEFRTALTQAATTGTTLTRHISDALSTGTLTPPA